MIVASAEQKAQRDDPWRPGIGRIPYPTVQEQRLYYGGVLRRPVPESALQFVTQCIFRPHRDGLWVNLESGRWRCPGCGEGDVFDLEARRPSRNHRISPWDMFWQIVAEAKEQAAQTDGTTQARVELTTIEEYESRRVLELIRRHAGKSHRYFQQVAHVPAPRFNRIIRHLEQENRVSCETRPSTAGRRRRTYSPVQDLG